MIDDLRALAAVIEARSVTKAATRLSLTQSAVSRRLQHLEEMLGGNLFDRTQRPPTPTALGLRVLEQALPILRAVDDLVLTAQDESDPIGTMRLGIAQAIGDLVLTQIVQQLHRAFPTLDLRLRTDWSRGLFQQILDGKLDGALVLMPPSSRIPSGMAGRCLTSIKTGIIQAKKMPRTRGPVRLARLSKEAWVLNPLGCGYRSALETAMGQRDGTLRVAIDTFGLDVQLRMVASGVGLGLVPLAAIKSSAVRRDIRIVDVTDFTLTLDAWLVHQRQTGNLRRALDVVAEEVSERLLHSS